MLGVADFAVAAVPVADFADAQKDQRLAVTPNEIALTVEAEMDEDLGRAGAEGICDSFRHILG